MPIIIKQNPASRRNLSSLVFCDQARKKTNHIMTSIIIKAKVPFKINTFNTKERLIIKLKINNILSSELFFYFKIKIAKFSKLVKIKKPLVIHLRAFLIFLKNEYAHELPWRISLLLERKRR